MSACDIGRERIHAALDADDPAAAAGLAEHLAVCAGCRELHDDLLALRGALRARPVEAFPADALEAVWNKTVRAPRSRWDSGGRRAAVAAVLVTGISLSTLWLLRSPAVPPGPSAADLARAEAQADLVFGYAARALNATRVAAADRVVASKVSPAVRGDAAASRRP